MIILNKICLDPGLLELLLLIAFQKKASLILEHFRLDQENIGYSSGKNFQGALPSFIGIAGTC